MNLRQVFSERANLESCSWDFSRLIFEVIEVGIVKDLSLSLEDNSVVVFFQKAMRMLK